MAKTIKTIKTDTKASTNATENEIPDDFDIGAFFKGEIKSTKKEGEKEMKTNEKQTKTNTKTTKKTEEKEMNKKANANTNTTNNAGMDEILSALLAQQRILNEQIARFAQMLGNTEDEQTEAVEVAEKQEKTTTKKTTNKTATKKSGKKSAKGEIEGAKIVTFTDNAGNERIAICFEEKPSAAVRDALKKQGHFRFYAKTDNPNVKNAWVRKDSESARTALAKIAEAV